MINRKLQMGVRHAALAKKTAVFALIVRDVAIAILTEAVVAFAGN